MMDGVLMNSAKDFFRGLRKADRTPELLGTKPNLIIFGAVAPWHFSAVRTNSVANEAV